MAHLTDGLYRQNKFYRTLALFTTKENRSDENDVSKKCSPCLGLVFSQLMYNLDLTSFIRSHLSYHYEVKDLLDKQRKLSLAESYNKANIFLGLSIFLRTS